MQFSQSQQPNILSIYLADNHNSKQYELQLLLCQSVENKSVNINNISR